MIEPEILKLVIPLIGVLIGWFLNSVTGLQKEKTETNQKLGKAISNLIEFDLELISLQRQFNLFKEASNDIGEFEKYRQKIIDRYTKKNESFEKVLNSIDDISGFYPIEGMKLKALINNYLFSKKISLKETSKIGEQTYIYLLSMYEAGLEVQQKRLEDLIQKLAYKHSFSQWWKVKKYLKEMKENSKKTEESSYHRGLGEIMSTVANLKNKQEKELDLESIPEKKL